MSTLPVGHGSRPIADDRSDSDSNSDSDADADPGCTNADDPASAGSDSNPGSADSDDPDSDDPGSTGSESDPGSADSDPGSTDSESDPGSTDSDEPGLANVDGARLAIGTADADAEVEAAQSLRTKLHLGLRASACAQIRPQGEPSRALSWRSLEPIKQQGLGFRSADEDKENTAAGSPNRRPPSAKSDIVQHKTLGPFNASVVTASITMALPEQPKRTCCTLPAGLSVNGVVTPARSALCARASAGSDLQ